MSEVRPRAARILLTFVLAITALPVVDGPLSTAEPSKKPLVRKEKVIPHTDVPLARQPVPVSPAGGPTVGASWPSAGAADVLLPKDVVPENSRRADLGAEVAGPRQAGALPVTLSTRSGEAGTVHVRLADQDVAQRAGVTGVLLSVGSESALSTSVNVNYAGFRQAGGAGFGSRLRLVRMPACALTTPQAAACQVRTPLVSHNDTAAQVVSADVALAPDTVLAAVADSSGPQGTFTASSLAPSGTWSVTGSSGAFAWSYPITVPPAATGTAIAPKVALVYSSSSVDGRTSGTNNQPSWIGQGWDYSPGYIERTYRTCDSDEGLPAAQQTADLCWAGQIVTMNLGGQSVPLVYDDATQSWHPGSDNGSRVELRTGAGNGVLNGEHWRVTTTDGTQYWFGRTRGPGYTNQEQTNSTWGVPVYGPRAGDPCHSPAGFAQSSCTQAWRWNLDYVEDPHGNATVYYYRPESNFYGADNGTTGVAYTRGGTLARIDYGIRKFNGSIYGQTVPAQVLFAVTERCDPSGAITCDPGQFTAANATYWPDTPQDQQCLSGAVCNNHGPSFWSTKRLSAITTQTDTGSGPSTVDKYQLTQSLPRVNDSELRLDSVVHTGYDRSGSSITLPPVQFTSQALDNRVPGFNNQPAMAHWRLTNIATETGSFISISYSATECGPGNMPTDQADVTKRCFPVYWTLPYQTEPTLDYFHKYVVTQVQVQDRNAVSPTQLTTYTYLGNPAWHFDDNEVVKPKHRTYGQFRGYQQVEVRTGDPARPQDGRSLTRTTYFRGMDGDTLPGGARRPASVTNSLNETVPDNDLYADTPLEVQTFDGDGGPRLSTQVSEPTTIRTTASRARTGLPALTATMVGTTRTRTITTLAGGGTRTTSSTNRYDALGHIVATTDSGDGVPDLCTTTHYADNTTSWIRDHVSENLTSQQVCPAEGVAPAPVLAASRTYYDNSATLGEVTGAGDATRTDRATATSGGSPTFETVSTAVFDPAGRPTSTVDALHRATGTTYTPTDGGLLSKIVTTNPKNQASSVELEPSRGLATATVDVGGRRTDAGYDQLGRLTALWNPGRAKGSDSANLLYSYLLRTDGPLAVTTKTLVDYGTGANYVTSVSLYDALGQLRQTQADDVSDPTAVRNRVVRDNFYDSKGQLVRSNNRYVTSGVPGTTLVSVGDADVDDRTTTDYDGSGRATKVTSYRGLTATWDTRTVYGGDRTTVFPPLGGVTTSTLTDARGQTTDLRQYTAAPTVSDNVVSGGSYQTTTYHYTPLGQLDRMTDPAGNAWTYGYDPLGRQTSATDPDSGARTSGYDLAGQLTSTTDARGQTVAIDYDPLGRKLTEYSGSKTGPKLASWTYDTAKFGIGKLAGTTRYTPAGNYRTAISGYDSAGNPWDVWVQIPAGETGLGGDYQTTFSWTTTGLRTGTTPVAKGGLPAEVVAMAYDPYGHPKSTQGYNSYVSASSYTSFGEPAQYTLGVLNSTGWLTFDRDAQTRRVTDVNLSAQQAWPQLDDLRYSYDPAGNITRIVNVQGQPEAGAPTRTQCFGYDPLDRLTEAWTATDNCAAAPSGSTVGGVNRYWTTWSFDQIGLRHTQVQHATAGDTTTTYTYPASGNGAVRPHALSGTSATGPGGTVTTSYSYNQSGDTTGRNLPAGNQTLTWNEYNRVASVSTPAGTTGYVYDADGNQLVRRDPGKTTLYLPGEEITRDSATGTLTGTRYYATTAPRWRCASAAAIRSTSSPTCTAPPRLPPPHRDSPSPAGTSTPTATRSAPVRAPGRTRTASSTNRSTRPPA